MSRHASAAGTRWTFKVLQWNFSGSHFHSPPMPLRQRLPENSLLCAVMFWCNDIWITIFCQVQIAELWHVPATGWCSAQITGKACSQVCTCMHKFYLIKFPPRQRIYSCSLDFFCADKMYPVRLDQLVLMGPFDTCPQGWPWSERGLANPAEVLVNDALW